MHACDTRRFFFLHIPKTGGTSFRHMLYELFPPGQVLSNELDIAANGGRYLGVEQVARLPRERLAACRLLVGHLPFAAGKLFEPAPRVLVFLRDPAVRTLSNLRHIQRVHHVGLSLREVMNLPGVAARSAANRQTRMLSFSTAGEAAADEAAFEPDRGALERARENLASCAFVGLTERFGESVTLCERTFGWTFSSRGLRKNISPPLDEDPGDLLPRIREQNRLDAELYGYARELFEARLAAG